MNLPDMDTADIVITGGRKPWELKCGDRIVAVGILSGNTLMVDYFRKYRDR